MSNMKSINIKLLSILIFIIYSFIVYFELLSRQIVFQLKYMHFGYHTTSMYSDIHNFRRKLLFFGSNDFGQIPFL